VLARLRQWREATLVVAILLFGAFAALTHGSFLTLGNLENVAVQSSMILLVGFGMTVVIIAGGIDLSVGSTAAVVGVTTVWLLQEGGLAALPAFALAIALGALVGLVNGAAVVWLRVPGIIVTLGAMTALRGVAFLLAGGYAVRSTDPSLAFIAQGSVVGIPLPILIVLAAVALVHLLLGHTTFGREFYAVGGNSQAARLAGLNIRLITLAAYVICATLAAVAGLIAASRTQAGSPIIGIGWELEAVAIVVLGGANLFGGAGRVLGTLLAGLLLGMIKNWISLQAISSAIEGIVTGTLLIVIVAFGVRQRGAGAALRTLLRGTAG
jgi:ribose transport system permease protein